MRRLFVGDIQGCREELERMLDEVRFDPAADRLYSVGDAINRGPDSAGVVRLLRQLQARMVLGNHELHYFAVRAGLRAGRGRDTLSSLLVAEDEPLLARWLMEQPLLWLEDDVILVHAGLCPTWRDLEVKAEDLRQRLDRMLEEGTDEDEEVQKAVGLRLCEASGRRPAKDWPDPGEPYRPWDEFHADPRTVVFGHWARRGLVVKPRVRGLDTGCVYGDHLTAWIPEEDRIVQVQAARAYCSTKRKRGE